MPRAILRQKLTLPPVWGEALHREKLESRLDTAIESGQHVLLCAGSGYGKTTLLAAWCRRRPSVWLTLDAEDADLDVFLAYLIAAFERTVAGFRTEAVEMLPRAREREGAHAALSALLADLDEQCDRPLILVLDDYHLAATPTLDSLVARLVKYLPDPIRLVLASRKQPDVELAALQARRQMLLMDEPTLAFDADELRALRPDQPEAAIAYLLTSTGGWPAAMGMTPELLDAYLEEQLLRDKTADTRAFLLKLSVVESFDEPLCIEALNAPLSQGLRDDLLRDRLIFPHGVDRYVLHPALRNMLHRRFLTQVPPEARRELLRRVGDYQWRVGQASTALRFWIDAGEETWAADRLSAIAEDWLAEGRLEALASAINALGVEAGRPEFLLMQGELQRRWGDFSRAGHLLERAIEAFGADADSVPRAIARLRQAQVAAGRGDVVQARQFLAEAGLARRAATRYEIDGLLVEGGLALLSGETEQATAFFQSALATGQRYNDPYAEARAVHNLGVCYIRLGEFRRALECYEASPASASGDGMPLVWMTPINRALVLIYLGRLNEARDAAEAALTLVRRYKLTREEGYALRILGFAQLKRGALEEASTCFESAELLARRMNDTLGIAYSLNFRAELALVEGDVAAASALAIDVERLMGGEAAVVGISEFAQVRAKVYLAAGRQAEARPLVAALLERAKTFGYRHLLEETEQLALRLETETAEGTGFQAVSMVSASPHEPAEETPPELEIRCFGGFRVRRAGVEVGDRDWQTSRAKLLLAFFLFTPEGATKTHLLDAVFPREEITNALMNMTLMRVRKALEPGLEKGQPSRFLLRSDGRYAFNWQTNISLDVREFEHACRAARLATSDDEAGLLAHALALYSANFLPEFDNDWVVALRHKHQDMALGICRRLLAIYDDREPDAAFALIYRALTIDPLSEEFNREIILRHLEAGEPHRATQHYQLCARRYQEILNCEPPVDLALLVQRA